MIKPSRVSSGRNIWVRLSVTIRTASRSTSGVLSRSALASCLREFAASVAITAVTKPVPPIHKGPADDASDVAQLHRLNSIVAPPHGVEHARHAFLCLQ